VDNLSRLNNDMKNLLDSTEIATVFPGHGASRPAVLRPGRTGFSKLIPGDVDRPITDIASELTYPELADDMREVLRTLAVHEQAVAARNGHWFQVRIYALSHGWKNLIDGVILTLTDITVSKMLEEKLRATQTGLGKSAANQNLKFGAVRGGVAGGKETQGGK